MFVSPSLSILFYSSEKCASNYCVQVKLKENACGKVTKQILPVSPVHVLDSNQAAIPAELLLVPYTIFPLVSLQCRFSGLYPHTGVLCRMPSPLRQIKQQCRFAVVVPHVSRTRLWVAHRTPSGWAVLACLSENLQKRIFVALYVRGHPDVVMVHIWMI